ncbi:hypothetical protein GCM10010969_30650 [Saccharibacillus kuerlensis]|uniref:Hyaluronan synthase n=2 Tax=Saccharibacillus kuerlensis TaxID=459527 RepID=A0ABQ2L8E5_9BACL|nr:hypothetical protein GCM10010969_30650 [Saccharibacillus kuerlensis]
MIKLKKKVRTEEVLSMPQDDRRTLSYVPDPEQVRGSVDRRGASGYSDPTFETEDYVASQRLLSLRYAANFEILVVPQGVKKKNGLKGTVRDISSTGLRMELPAENAKLAVGTPLKSKFRLPEGVMPEGFEAGVNLEAEVVRTFTEEQDGRVRHMVALKFVKPLTEYFQRKRWGYSIYAASILLFAVSLFILLMRTESIIYYEYKAVLYTYSIVAALFLLTRYLFGALYRNVPVNPDYTPGVSIIIPCFNEADWIKRTILSCINQNYPVDKLEVIVVDDRSTDNSVEKIREVIELVHQEAERYATRDRLSYTVLERNAGKREALVKGVELAKHDLVVFVDSDSFLEPNAIRHLVQPFQNPKMGGVAGRTDVENKYTNTITKLQTVRYYVAFRIMKAAESWFDCVTCLSGPLSCYRKELILKHKDAWLNQKFLGRPATFGDDRSMTNFILQTHQTGYQDNAICSTIVPSDTGVFLKQQMRWKRSWLRESLRAGGFIWKKEPLMALFFYVGLIVPIAAPVVVVYNLIYVPIVHGLFPGTFLIGLLLMATLMSLAHLFFRKSRLWLFGFVFCIFYEFVLLWQMPVAWVTFWKSTWGTRETPQDIEAREKKEARKSRGRRFGLPF